MSKRLKVLSGVLAALVVVAGGLYVSGYFETWKDQAAKLEAEMQANMAGQVPPELQLAADAYASCMAEKLSDVAEQAGCSLESRKPLLPQLSECAQTVEGVGMVFQITNMICQQEAASKVPQEPGSQP